MLTAYMHTCSKKYGMYKVGLIPNRRPSFLVLGCWLQLAACRTVMRMGISDVLNHLMLLGAGVLEANWMVYDRLIATAAVMVPRCATKAPFHHIHIFMCAKTTSYVLYRRQEAP